jgi:acylphosphatase
MSGNAIAGSRFRFLGRVKDVGFAGFVVDRARRLDLAGWVREAEDGSVESVVQGPPDLLDAMEQACWLGPIEALVSDIERESIQPNEPYAGFAQRDG